MLRFQNNQLKVNKKWTQTMETSKIKRKILILVYLESALMIQIILNQHHLKRMKTNWQLQLLKMAVLVLLHFKEILEENKVLWALKDAIQRFKGQQIRKFSKLLWLQRFHWTKEPLKLRELKILKVKLTLKSSSQNWLQIVRQTKELLMNSISTWKIKALLSQILECLFRVNNWLLLKRIILISQMLLGQIWQMLDLQALILINNPNRTRHLVIIRLNKSQELIIQIVEILLIPLLDIIFKNQDMLLQEFLLIQKWHLLVIRVYLNKVFIKITLIIQSYQISHKISLFHFQVIQDIEISVLKTILVDYLQTNKLIQIKLMTI